MVWQIAYCIIAALIVVVFPFFIFYYENDDENMGAKEGSEGNCFTGCAMRFAAFRRSFCVAFSYTLVCVVIGVVGFFVLQHYIAYTQIPYKLISVGVGTKSFQEISAVSGFAGACTNGALCPCGRGSCAPSTAILRMDVTLVVFLAACISFLGWFLFSIYVGIGFIGLPMDCFNAFIHRPKLLSVSEARNQKKALMKRSEELIKVREWGWGGVGDGGGVVSRPSGFVWAQHRRFGCRHHLRRPTDKLSVGSGRPRPQTAIPFLTCCFPPSPPIPPFPHPRSARTWRGA
jgi:hypothetical protein